MTIKQVVLRFGRGSVAAGFDLHLRIYTAAQTLTELDGALPPDPVLLAVYEQLRESYRQQCHLAYRGFRGLEALDEVTHISIRDTAVDLAEGLNHWLDHSPDFQPIREELLHHLNSTDRVRFVIHTQDPVLQWLPWHLCYLFQRYRYGGISLSLPRRSQSIPLVAGRSRVKVLAVLGDSTGIDIQADLLLLQDKLPPDAEILPPLIATPRKVLGQTLWEQNPDILFFAGHSSSTGPQGEFFLNEFESVAIADLKFALGKAIERGLKLAIFNSCDGLKLAQDLADLNLPAIIVMRERVPDAAAQHFLDYFLTAFAHPTEPKPLTLAVREAQERLHHWEQDYPCASWLPVLCQQSEAADLTWQDLLVKIPAPTPKPQNHVLPRKRHHWLSLALGSIVFCLTLFGLFPQISYQFALKAAACIDDEDLDCVQKNASYALLFNFFNASAHSIFSQYYDKVQDRPRWWFHINFAVALGNASACTQKFTYLMNNQEILESESLIFTCERMKIKTDMVQYAIDKNYGWLYLEQDKLTEARYALRKSMEHRPDQVVPHCLMAQVKMKEDPQGLKSEIIKHWEPCIKYARRDRIEELKWLKMGEDYLNQIQE